MNGADLGVLPWLPRAGQGLVATRTLMRYGPAHVKKCHFRAAGRDFIGTICCFGRHMCAHTHALPPPKVFNLSLKADWNRRANPSLISEWQALLRSASPSSCCKLGWLLPFSWWILEQSLKNKIAILPLSKQSLAVVCDFQEPQREGWGTCTETRTQYSAGSHCSVQHREQEEETERVWSPWKPHFSAGITQSHLKGHSPIPICQVSNHSYMVILP